MNRPRLRRLAALTLTSALMSAVGAGTALAGPAVPAGGTEPAPRAATVTTHQAALEFTSDGTFEGTVTCPNRRAQTTGGGYALREDGHAFESRPDGNRSWHVKASAPGVVYVRCLLVT
ncbi:hypothetical protein [Streptomyces sp. NPDC018045]|uniref:hypothetical protein n=1 Tax=Streptomyces sp. NPDC018045 TaxID=3365037 RepID=UPI003793B836